VNIIVALAKALLEHFNYIICSRDTEGWVQTVVCIIFRREIDIKIETVATVVLVVGVGVQTTRIVS
jgi:hypothetical protein